MYSEYVVPYYTQNTNSTVRTDWGLTHFLSEMSNSHTSAPIPDVDALWTSKLPDSGVDNTRTCPNFVKRDRIAMAQNVFILLPFSLFGGRQYSNRLMCRLLSQQESEPHSDPRELKHYKRRCDCDAAKEGPHKPLTFPKKHIGGQEVSRYNLYQQHPR
jgi:hypothetical protein